MYIGMYIRMYAGMYVRTYACTYVYRYVSIYIGMYVCIKGKAVLVQAYFRHWEFQEVKAPRFWDNWHMKKVQLSAPHTSCLYPSGNIPGSHFFYSLSRPQSNSQSRRIMSMKNSNDIIRNQTHKLPACRTAPQPTALPWAPIYVYICNTYIRK